jgi:hypothetical protein
MTPLRQSIDDYLTLRRRLGVTLHTTGHVLAAFATYAEDEGAAHVTTDLVLRWASRLTSASPATLNGRVQMIRRFAFGSIDQLACCSTCSRSGYAV